MACSAHVDAVLNSPARPAQAPQQCHALRLCGWRAWRGSHAAVARRGCVRRSLREHML